MTGSTTGTFRIINNTQGAEGVRTVFSIEHTTGADAIEMRGGRLEFLLNRFGMTDAGRFGIGTITPEFKERLLERVDIPIVVPEATTSDRIQEVHIKVLHIAIEAVERVRFPENY